MHFHIITLFEDVMRPYLESSILGRAKAAGIYNYTLYNLADYSVRNTRRTDDAPYGGGQGTVLQIEPLARAVRAAESQIVGKPDYICMMPSGNILSQTKLERLAKRAHDTIIVCGHYEGIDERLFVLFPFVRISLGRFVLTGGELPTLTLIDGIVRLLPGAIKDASSEEESYSATFGRARIEYPHYTRPEVFEGLAVPDILLSGNHKNIQRWRSENLQ